jgi:hypothetical protein
MLRTLGRGVWHKLTTPPNMPQYRPREARGFRQQTLAREWAMPRRYRMHRRTCCTRCMRAAHEEDYG